MDEEDSLRKHPGDPRVEELYRVFLSRYDEGKGRTRGGSSHQRASDFLPLLFEEIEAVSHALGALDGELGQTLVSIKHHEQQQADELRSGLHRARKRLRQIAGSLTTAPEEPQEWDLAGMLSECAGLLAGEMRAQEIKLSMTGGRDIPPVVLRHPRPRQALFAMLQGMVESKELAGGRIVIQISRVGERTFAELFAHHGAGVLDREKIPLASLLPLSVTDGVHLDWEATPGRFALRMEFPDPITADKGPGECEPCENSVPGSQNEG